MKTTRREFTQIAGATVVAIGLGRASSKGSPVTPDPRFEHGMPLQELQYGQVSFQPGLHTAQLEQTHSVLMGLSPDSLLKPHRSAAGLPAPGCDLGGWYHSHGPETFGQWLSALARYYAITADEATRERIQNLTQQFALTVAPESKIYQAGSCAYLYDKLVCGLLDAYRLAGQPMALPALAKVTEVAAPALPKSIENRGYELGEPYTLPENQFLAWQHTGSAVHLELAQRYLHHAFLDPLAGGENVLAGRHAYSHVNALCSAAKAYLVLGDEKYLRAAKNGLSFVEAQSFATGGWGPNESFIPAELPFGGAGGPESAGWMPEIRTLGDSLAGTHMHFETCCGAYAHFKLTRYLLRITRDSRYGDSMERVMYNTILGATPMQANGMAFYYSDYHANGHRAYFVGYGFGDAPEWPCCSGTLPQIAADYWISTYFGDAQGVYVNLFIPSTVKWRQNGAEVSLTQSGAYPLDGLVRIVVETSRSQTFTLRVRVPAWAETPSIRINGKRALDAAQPGTFAHLTREWRSGDQVELEFPMKVELKAVDAERPDTVAVVCGPLVLFAVGTKMPRVAREQLLLAARPSADKPEWYAGASGSRLRLVPFWAIKPKESYSTYLSLS